MQVTLVNVPELVCRVIQSLMLPILIVYPSIGIYIVLSLVELLNFFFIPVKEKLVERYNQDPTKWGMPIESIIKLMYVAIVLASLVWPYYLLKSVSNKLYSRVSEV